MFSTYIGLPKIIADSEYLCYTEGMNGVMQQKDENYIIRVSVVYKRLIPSTVVSLKALPE